jgi:MoxR-like ATPase
MSGDGPHDTITGQALDTALAEQVAHGLVDRSHEAALLVLALLSGEHALLVGASGMGKTLLARRLAACVHGARIVEHTLDASSLVEDVLGPLSWPAVEAGRHERLLAGHAADAELVVLDEVHTASGAVLDALRSLLDDRRVRVGARVLEAPLVLAIGTMREPVDTASALMERFLFTIPCEPVASIEALLDARSASAVTGAAQRVTTVRLASLRERAEGVELGLATRVVLVGLADALARASIIVSNGRWQRIARAVRIQAVSRGRDRTTLADLWFLPNAVVTDARALAAASEAVVVAARSLTEGEPARLAAQAGALTEAVTAALRATELATNATGAALFLDEEGAETTLHARTRHLVDGQGRPLYHPPHELGSRIRKLTFEDLWELHFQRLPGGMARLKAYVSSPTNQILEEAPREPVRRPKRHAKAVIEGFLATAAELEREIAALARALFDERPEDATASAVLGLTRKDFDDAIGALHASLAEIERVREAIARLPRSDP